MSLFLLPAVADVPAETRRRVERDYVRFATSGEGAASAGPGDLDDYLLQEYGLDVAAEYAGLPIRNPWGKASGQLSMTARQVQEDVDAGLGFVVLKTVIAEDETGSQSMQDWAIPESQMTAARIIGRRGEAGWTIDWKGRGWWQSFDAYLQLVRDSRRIAAAAGTAGQTAGREPRETLIVPSCKFHLPPPGESTWRTAEYAYTVRRLLDAYSEGRAAADAEPMPLEKDFSPTLAGSDRSSAEETILDWLRVVPGLIRDAAGDSPVRIGLKIFNALFEDDFQLEMLRTIHAPHAGSPRRADFFIYGNRLFDPDREFEGRKGIAYGGPDLSDRNLRVLSRFREERPAVGLPLSATGNIATGKTAVEYALRGATSFQMHTFFQLPAGEYRMKSGGKTQKALHELIFHPEHGFVVWVKHAGAAAGLSGEPLRFLDLPAATD